LRLGLLTPRHGEEVVGGTEHWLRSLCEQLVSERGWTVEVFTTCAVSALTWADEYDPGSSQLNGVTVNRFPSRSRRDRAYLTMLPRLRRDASAFDAEEADRYVSLVGPVCPEAVDAAVESECDLVAVTPYLYWPAVNGLPRLGRRAVFHCAAHDEPELYLPQMASVFTAGGGLAYNTFSERDLVERTYPVGHLPSAVIGISVTAAPGDPAAARAALGVQPGERFVLCLGKVERAKGSDALARMWAMYRQRRPEAPTLIFVGPVAGDVAEADGVIYAGRQPDAVKWGALAGCELLVAPSVQESFNIVVVEAWLSGRPVLVDARCGPTVENCRRSGGGIWYADYGEFEVAVDRLLADPAERHSLAANGKTFAQSAFSWPSVLDRYEDLTQRIAGRR
jgi:glycosyltransferase involved in cell wall biosynthesis